MAFSARTATHGIVRECVLRTDTYLTRTWKGPTSGFKATKVIYDRKTDTNGYVGILPSTNEIYVVYRGSQTLKNWLTNLQFAKADYSYPNCAGCLVHNGFFEAEQAVISEVLAEVSRLSKQYGTKKGESISAAVLRGVLHVLRWN